MQDQMRLELLLSGKSSIAKLANKWPRLSVSQHMLKKTNVNDTQSCWMMNRNANYLSERVFGYKRFPAKFAGKEGVLISGRTSRGTVVSWLHSSICRMCMMSAGVVVRVAGHWQHHVA